MLSAKPDALVTREPCGRCREEWVPWLRSGFSAIAGQKFNNNKNQKKRKNGGANLPDGLRKIPGAECCPLVGSKE